MRADFKVCLDACVLANFGVADLLLKLAERPRQYVPVWSEEILSEVRRTQKDRLKWPDELADSFGDALRTNFPSALTSHFEHLIERMTNDPNDPKDQHVLAAAIHGGAEVILRDFPCDALAPWGIEAKHPQDYLLTLYEMGDIQVVSRIVAIAAERERTSEDILIHLGKSVPRFAARLLDDLELI